MGKETEKEFVFEWANGSKKAKGKNYKEACKNLGKIIKPNKVLTGFLVRIKQTSYNALLKERKQFKWGYWDAEQFWKYLKK